MDMVSTFKALGLRTDDLLPLGQVFVTHGVNDLVNDGIVGQLQLIRLVHRHAMGDWGDLCEEDRLMNEEALDPECPERVLSSYPIGCHDKVWIITEWDRSRTTLLLPEEY
ncbi:MAG: hypothetical protein IJ026_05635 [Candidatus Methanomethylophilaceae archaeon]|nr:hypothetical protein [Candidatus Methanomethylophilaceae archaeon]